MSVFVELWDALDRPLTKRHEIAEWTVTLRKDGLAVKPTTVPRYPATREGILASIAYFVGKRTRKPVVVVPYPPMPTPYGDGQINVVYEATGAFLLSLAFFGPADDWYQQGRPATRP